MLRFPTHNKASWDKILAGITTFQSRAQLPEAGATLCGHLAGVLNVGISLSEEYSRIRTRAFESHELRQNAAHHLETTIASTRRKQQELERLTKEVAELEAAIPTLESTSRRTRLEAAEASAALATTSEGLRLHGDEVRRIHDQTKAYVAELGLTGPDMPKAGDHSSGQASKRKESAPASIDLAVQPPSAKAKAKTTQKEQKAETDAMVSSASHLIHEVHHWAMERGGESFYIASNLAVQIKHVIDAASEVHPQDVPVAPVDPPPRCTCGIHGCILCWPPVDEDPPTHMLVPPPDGFQTPSEAPISFGSPDSQASPAFPVEPAVAAHGQPGSACLSRCLGFLLPQPSDAASNVGLFSSHRTLCFR